MSRNRDQQRQRLHVCSQMRAMFPIFSREGPDAGFAAREKGTGEGIGWFAAKRGDVADGRARGIEAEMVFGMRAYAICPYM